MYLCIMKNIIHKTYRVPGIYEIKNTINGKIYIGSSNNIYHRVKRHLSDLRKNKKPNPILQNAFNKYGEDVFYTSIIEHTSDLLAREEYWINLLQPKYNCVLIHIQRPVISDSMRIKISNTLKAKYKAGYKSLSEKPINVYNLKGELIHTFNKIKDALKPLNVSHSSITRVLQGKHKQANGYIFRLTSDSTPVDYKKAPRRIVKSYKPVIVYDIKTGKQLYFASAKDAKIYFNSNISSTIKQKSLHKKRYIIRYLTR